MKKNILDNFLAFFDRWLKSRRLFQPYPTAGDRLILAINPRTIHDLKYSLYRRSGINLVDIGMEPLSMEPLSMEPLSMEPFSRWQEHADIVIWGIPLQILGSDVPEGEFRILKVEYEENKTKEEKKNG